MSKERKKTVENCLHLAMSWTEILATGTKMGVDSSVCVCDVFFGEDIQSIAKEEEDSGIIMWLHTHKSAKLCSSKSAKQFIKSKIEFKLKQIDNQKKKVHPPSVREKKIKILVCVSVCLFLN